MVGLHTWLDASPIMPTQLFLPHIVPPGSPTPTAAPSMASSMGPRLSRLLPVLVFLHGGADHSFASMNAHSLPLLLRKNSSFAASFPFIALFPCSSCSLGLERGWVPSNLDRVTKLISKLVKEYHADRHRIVLTGPGMGGAGVLRYAAAAPRIFSALCPIAPALRPAKAIELVPSLCCAEGPSAGCCPSVWVRSREDSLIPIRDAMHIPHPRCHAHHFHSPSDSAGLP